MLVDRYLLWISSGGVAVFWVLAGIFGWPISPGAQAAFTVFLANAALKTQTDRRWRELEEGEADRLALEEGATPAVAIESSKGKPQLKEGGNP